MSANFNITNPKIRKLLTLILMNPETK